MGKAACGCRSRHPDETLRSGYFAARSSRSPCGEFGYAKRRSRHQDTDQVTTYTTYPKVVFVVDCPSHMIPAAVPGRGPGSDLVQFGRVLSQAVRRARIGALLADADFDAGWVHRSIRSHPAGAQAAVRQATGRPLAATGDAAVRRLLAQVRATMAGGDVQLDDQAAPGLGAACATVRESVSRDRSEGHYA